MNGRYVLATNIVIALFDEEQAVLERIAAAEDVLIPIPAAGELYYGAIYSRPSDENVARVNALVESHSIVDIDVETARHYGAIKSVASQRHSDPEQRQLDRGSDSTIRR